MIESMRPEIVAIPTDLAGDVVADHPRRDADGVGDALGVGAAVAFYDQAVEAEKDRTIVIVGVEMDLQGVQRRLRQGKAGLRSQRAGKSAAQQIGDEPGGALGG